MFIKQKIKDTTISPVETLRIRARMMDEISHTGGEFDEIKFEQSILEYKKYILRRNFFELFPEKRKPYENSLINNRQTCADGGFESGAPTSLYTFKTAINPTTGISTNIITTGSNFVPISVSSSLDDDNSFLTLVSPGLDPHVPVSRVFNGNRSIKLNASVNPEAVNNFNVTTMSRNFIVNESTFNYNYSLILRNPNHPILAQPFFVVRIYDTDDNILRQHSVISNRNDCLFSNAGTTYDPLLFTGWVCDQIDTSSLIGQEVRVEFIIADCSWGGHFGTVYIDDICNTNCATSFSGGISLDQISTINCPTDTLTICGTYTLPQQAILNPISPINLNIIQSGSVINTIYLPSILTSSNFCFEVPISAFGVNPSANFEFQAVANFTRICTIQGNFDLDPIYSLSSNVTGPDVSIINCIDAVNDSFTTSTCLLGSFNILDNDSVFGNQATSANTMISTSGPLNPNVLINTSTGQVTLTSGISPGVYTINYQICNANIPLHCDQGIITITVTNPQVNANDDDFSSLTINSCEGGILPTVFSNDSYCGVNVNSTNSNVTLINNGGVTAATIDSNGLISIPSGTPSGTFSLQYEICQMGTTVFCDTANVTVVVTPGAIPMFNILTTLCNGVDAPILPTVSDNGITGTWSPTTIDNTTSGTYTFTPTGNCALLITIDIDVVPECGLYLEWGSDVSCQLADDEDPKIRLDDDIVDGPCIRVCENSTIHYEINGNTSTIDYTEWIITGGNVTSSTDTDCNIQWASSSYSAINVIVHLTDGTTQVINRCIEKLDGPKALFGVLPDTHLQEVTVCENAEVIFDNLTVAAGGHDNIYYNWNFGDGNTSNEFEPTHIYTNSGSYTVTLTAFNGCSCVGVYEMKVIVERGIQPIECPTVVCEGEEANYYVPKKYEQCDVEWNVQGGEITWHNASNTEITIVWNHVDESGFGYITVTGNGCYECSTTIKVPVVKNKGTIIGSSTLCEKNQGLYSLPQWPTTEFNWTLEDPTSTGAILIYTNQRNEVIVQGGYAGTLKLKCNYFNTLLGCGGVAEYQITVNPSLVVDGNELVCKNSNQSYSFLDDGNNVSSVNWIVTGPNGFTQSGSGSPMNITFTEVGVYNFDVTSSNYCMREFFNVQVIDSPTMPSSINGPLTICPGIPVEYSCTIPAGLNANWEVTNGTIIGSTSGSQILVNFDQQATTPYEVKVWFELDGCSSDVLVTNINRETPIINFILTSPEVCGSSYAVYQIDPINVDNYVWEIIPNSAGSIESGQNTNSITILWNQTPQTGVEVKVKVRKCGADFEDSTFVDIVSSPTVTMSAPLEVCTEASEIYSVNIPTGMPFTNVVWDFGNGDTVSSTASSTTYTYHEPISSNTNYTITATVYGLNGCAMPGIVSQVVEVSPSPVVTLSPTVNLNLCNPNNIPSDYTYTVNLQGGFGPTDTIQWFNSSGSLSGETYPTIDVTTYGVGTYYAVVTNEFDCEAITQEFTVINECDGSCAITESIDGTATITDCGEATIDITSYTGTPYETFILYPGSFSSNITSISNTQLVVSNLEPGEYSVTLAADYSSGSGTCLTRNNISFIIPYKAGLKYNVTCAGGNNYNVQLLDHSVFYPLTPATNFEFTTDNGGSWQTGTIVGGIAQISTTLAPGSYDIGIRISRPGDPENYPSCEYFETLVLPNYPVATFTTANPSVCQGDAMQFYADDTTPGLQYNWQFTDPANNLQQNPVKTFQDDGSQLVTLTVTNRYGCSATHAQFVNVVGKDINGALLVSPVTSCIGDNLTINVTSTGVDPIQTLYWYHNEYSAVPFATTHAPNLDLTVIQNGQYFVYAENANGCVEYDNIKAISAFFTPAPQSPVVKGEETVCIGNGITLQVPSSTSINYFWTLNGVPQPAWDGLTEINYLPSTTGSYTFGVIAQVESSSGNYCNSLETIHTVTVLESPEVPEIAITNVVCHPYQVTVEVTNPQIGVGYYWSNGDTGASAVITHDGPLQVRAEANGCYVTNQLDLPVDLETLAWIFPKGCFTLCKEQEVGYIIGPLGNFVQWNWLANGVSVLSGAGAISNLDPVSAPNAYQLNVKNEYCDDTFGIANFSSLECSDCKLDFEIGKPKCVKIDGVWVYEVNLGIYNNNGNPVNATLSSPTNQGYFVPSTLTVPSGSSSTTVHFYPTNGFNGGTITIDVNGTTEEGDCFTKFELYFSECEGLTPRYSNELQDETIHLSLAPNPAKEYTTISYEVIEKGKVQIEIRDAMGRIMETIEKNEPKGEVNLYCLKYAAGYYVVVLKQNGEVQESKKLLVQ